MVIFNKTIFIIIISGDARSKAFLQPYVDTATSLGEFLGRMGI